MSADLPSDPPVALVTGSAVRVGRAIATTLCHAGYRVWLHHHRSTDAARTLHAELSHAPVPPLPPITADLLDETARLTLMSTILDGENPSAGRLDLLVNNAAGFERGPLHHRSDDDLRRVLELNLVAPLSLARAAVGALATRRGSIINILDIAAIHPWPDYTDYCVAKAGLASATRGLAVELAPIRVNGVAPGTVAWPERLHEPARRQALVDQIPLRTIGNPTDVANAVLFLARSSHITGQILAVDGGRLAAAGGRRP